MRDQLSSPNFTHHSHVVASHDTASPSFSSIIKIHTLASAPPYYPLNTAMWNLLFAIPLLALAPLAEAQAGVLDYSKLPSCARQCAQLTQAQAACTTTPSTEKTCFCQSAYLTVQTNLFNTADGTCAAECPSADDRKKIQTWFIGICRNGGSGSGGGSSTPSASASTPSSTPSSQGGQRAESGSSANKDDGNQNKSW